MRKQVEESTAAESGRATRPAAERDRKGRFSARRKRATVSACCEARISSRCRGNWGSRDQFLAAGQAGLKSRAPDAREGAPAAASCSWRTSCSTRRWTTWRPAALWRGGGRRDEWRPVDLRPSGVRRTTGLPRVGTGAVQRLRATARDAVARLTAVPPRTRFIGRTRRSSPHGIRNTGTERVARARHTRAGAVTARTSNPLVLSMLE